MKDERYDPPGGAVAGFISACSYIKDPFIRKALLDDHWIEMARPYRTEDEKSALEILFAEYREMTEWIGKLWAETQGLEDAA